MQQHLECSELIFSNALEESLFNFQDYGDDQTPDKVKEIRNTIDSKSSSTSTLVQDEQSTLNWLKNMVARSVRETDTSCCLKLVPKIH